MYTASVALINRFAFTKLTGQPFIFLEFYYFDVLYIAVFSYVLSLHFSFYGVENTGLGLSPVPTKALMYVEEYNKENLSTDLNINTMIGSMAFIGLTRVIMSLKATKTLGPIISTIIYMFNDIMVFIMIWAIVLFMFTCIGILLFIDMDDLKEFKPGIVYWVNTALGNWDIEIFDHYLTSYP